MSKLYRIEEEDLAELEKIIPQLGEALPALSNKLRVQLRRVKSILSDVRWEYGPAGEIKIIPAEDTDHL